MHLDKIDNEWGCTHYCYHDSSNVKACIVTVEDLDKISEKLTSAVLDSSWMVDLDKGTKRTYAYTARDTADALVKIFKTFSEDHQLGAEFGEVMVSISSARSLSVIFDHIALPIAEIWKPQIKQNEGFDFHTECTEQFINFGEAKFSGSINPHGKAIPQAEGFINEEKHFRDRVHLVNLASQKSIDNLDDDKFGAIAAFSINSKDHASIMNNAIESIQKSGLFEKVQCAYVIGVVVC
ncbi:hypothetical protein EDB70_1011035 [Vibrio crassostreae]|nr:hypothetical protein EDB56_1011046 [Vibrio crassostreae]ROO76831.1 hypothetical protein EDB53_0659 [Vibrio crassostreae]ROR75598.1 hypothetical protein EDB54_1110 [Vibrio crassostreae]TCN99365.1 hypothetical protein EDB50_1011151 [Vibrio crassostreae]TCV33048.1 hypothetical protein EDB70_1011035 [Vibrio crassostreae]